MSESSSYNQHQICGFMRKYQLNKKLVEYCLTRKCALELLKNLSVSKDKLFHTKNRAKMNKRLKFKPCWGYVVTEPLTYKEDNEKTKKIHIKKGVQA